VIDAVIIVTYLAALTVVGLYVSRRQANLDDFFRARQSMAWLPVGLSLMAALDSAIDYVAYHTSIGFMWPSTFGLAATMVTGWGLSRLLAARPTEDAIRLTWRHVMRGEVAAVRS